MTIWPSVLASVFTVGFGLLLISEGTDQGQAWTAEGARRLSVREQPLTIPQAALLGDQGQKRELITPSSLEHDAPLILIDFIYTSCPTVCLAMGAEFRSLQTHLTSEGLGQRVKLLSLSFDERDKPHDLADYLQRFSADSPNWSAASFEDIEQLEAIKRKLGVIVIPEPTVGFVHNAAVYVTRYGKVLDILDYDDRKGIRDAVERHLLSNQYSLASGHEEVF